MLGSGAVDEGAGQVDDLLPLVEHPHPRGVSDIGDVSHLDVLAVAEGLELLLVLRLDDDRHPLLRLADGQLGGVHSAVLDRDTVKEYVESVGELAYGYAHSAGSEVIGFLYETGHLRPSEQPLQLPLLRGVTLLDLAAAGLERLLGVFLGRAGRSADSVTAGAAAQHQHHVARHRAFPSHVLGLHGTHDGTDLHPLGGVAFVVDLTHVRGRKAYLVAVG